MNHNPIGIKASLQTASGPVFISLASLAAKTSADVARLPHTAANLAYPEVDDMFDDLGKIVLKIGGEVILVPTDRMPTDSGAASIYRF